MEALPEWRRMLAMGFRHESGRRENALAFIELMRGLRAEYGMTDIPRFEYNQHGKPSLTGCPHIHFSISHCRVAAGCLISDVPCGFDVERIRKVSDNMIAHSMNLKEQEIIGSSPWPELAFVRLWTRKEALYKLWGTGIDDGLREVLCSPMAKGVALRTTENAADGYVMTEAFLIP